MKQLITLIAAIVAVVDKLKETSVDQRKQIDDLTQANIALQHEKADLLANHAQDQSDIDAAKAAKAAAVKAEDDAQDRADKAEAELASLHSEINAAVDEAKEHLDSITPKDEVKQIAPPVLAGPKEGDFASPAAKSEAQPQGGEQKGAGSESQTTGSEDQTSGGAGAEAQS